VRGRNSSCGGVRQCVSTSGMSVVVMARQSTARTEWTREGVKIQSPDA
jgi:hypothetical protein